MAQIGKMYLLFVTLKQMYGAYSEEIRGQQVNPCNSMFTQEQKTP